MLSARSVITFIIVTAVVATLAAILSLLRTPDSHGLASDSYGTRVGGGRGLYDLLSETGVQVDRSLGPPSSDMAADTTLVLWSPDASLVRNEPSYLNALTTWVEHGGRIVVAPPIRDLSTPRSVTRRSKGNDADLFKALGLESMWISTKTPDNEVSERATTRREKPRAKFEAVLKRSLSTPLPGSLTVTVTASGSLEPLHDRCQYMSIPSEATRYLAFDDDVTPDGTLEYKDNTGNDRILAAAFAREKGEIIVVADPNVCSNYFLGKSDNGVLAYDLLAGGGRRVVFDEFYHGLSVRGNPLWLLTLPGYAYLAAGMMTLVGMLLWRQGVAFGPPLERTSKSRRTILEYVDAMSRFFMRSRSNASFLLDEVRSGVLRTLGERFALGPGEPSPEEVAAAMRRRSTADAERFQAAMVRLDAAVQKGRRASATEVLESLRGVCRCL